MESIIQKYYLEPGSYLVNFQTGTNGVDCWFDTDKVRQHRCLSFEDFELISNPAKSVNNKSINLDLIKTDECADY